MGYNADNAEEKSSIVPPDSILDAVVIDIQDGNVGDFLNDAAKEKWGKDKLDDPAIQVEYEVTVPDHEEKVGGRQIFTYNIENGKTTFGEKSNMGKYNQKYGNPPKVGDTIKVESNQDGFVKIRL